MPVRDMTVRQLAVLNIGGLHLEVAALEVEATVDSVEEGVVQLEEVLHRIDQEVDLEEVRNGHLEALEEVHSFHVEEVDLEEEELPNQH